jgi:hypothetical protein
VGDDSSGGAVEIFVRRMTAEQRLFKQHVRTVADALATLLARQLIVGPRTASRDGYGITA